MGFAGLEAAGGNKLPRGVWLEGVLDGGLGRENQRGTRTWDVLLGGMLMKPDHL